MSIMITTTTTTTTTCTSIVTRSPSNSLQIANSSSSIPISTSSPFASFASSSPSANSSGWKEITPEIFTNINTFMRFQKKKPPPPGQQQSRGKWIYESDDDDCEMIGESNAITTKTTNPASATMSDIEVIEIEPEDVSSSKNEISIDISVVDKNDNRTQPNPHTASSSSSSSSFSQTAINEEPIKKSLTDNVSAKKLSTNHSIDQRWGECSAAAGKRDLKKEKEMEELHRQLAIAIAAENSALLDSDNRFDRKLAAAANPRFTYSNSAEDNRYEKCHRESYPLQNSSFLETIRLLVRPTEIPASYGTKTCGKTDHTNHDAAMNSIRQSSFDPNSTTLIYSDTHRRNVPSLAENHSRILRETIILILVHSGFTDASNHAVEALTDILEWYLERFFEHLRTCAETLDMLSDEIDESRNDSDRIEKRESRNHDLRRDEEDRNIRNLDQAMRQTMQHMKVPDICALARYQQQLDRYYDSTRRQDSKYDEETIKMLMQQRLHLTSASGIISLLDDQLPEMKIFALDRLNSVVDEFWAEISEVIPKIEILYEDESFPHRQLAALVASQVYYHLGSFEDSLTFALGAGSLFNVNSSSEYVDTVISKSIDHYTKLRLSNVGKIANQQPIDPRLEDIVNRMFQRCFTDGQFKQAIGIALETRRMDIFERAILESGDLQGMLAYAFKITMSLIDNLKYRNEVLKILVNMYKNLQVPDFISMVQCLIFLDDDKSIAELLDRLTRQSHESALMAYQIAFDLYESATQQFLARITESLRLVAPISSLISTVKNASSTAAATTTTASSTSAASGGSTAGTSSSAEPEKMETDVPAPPATESPKSASAPPSSATELKKEDLPEDEKRRQDRIENLVHILTGDTSIELDLQFLIRNNKTDLLILKNTKDAVRNSVCHNATVIANGLMHCGTTSDQFLRDNLDWLSRAVNWAKFSATASLGVIHKRHEKEALHLMSSYLPKDNGPGSGYTEGGGLYALGLIHANHGGTIIDYLLNQLKGATVEAVKHGGCLGLGLAAMGTHRNDVYEQLKYNLYQDDAVTGEAAGIAMGLVMLGSNSTVAIQDMVAYAQETQHEKILRGLAIGISLIMFTRLEEADVLIDTLCRDKDPLLRRSGMHTIAMAYCGTGNNQAIRKLLHVAVSDVNDDVRRAAVEALGFILFRTPEQCPSVVSLLSESFNPHVRYGAAMALGISCAGTGNKEALALLEPMTNDPINFVRQGALISSSLILIQQTEALCSKVKEYRALYQKVISDKHDDLMAKFGAILAQGIIDAGGRNATVSLQSRTGHTNLPAVVGMLVFTQFWYWFPLAHFISLTFTPTALIGLNSDLKMPKIEYRSSAKPSLYGYPAPLEEKKEKEREKVLTAVLSITAKAKKKEAEKKKEEKMDVDEAPPAGSPPPAKPSTSEDCSSTGKDGKKAATTEEAKTPKVEEKAADKAEDTKVVTEVAKDKPKDEAAKPKSEKESEPTFEMLSNPARVMPAQLKVLSMAEGCRYAPMKPLSIGGIILMADSKSGDAEDLVEPVQAGGPKVEEEKEPEPPEPFEYIE